MSTKIAKMLKEAGAEIVETKAMRGNWEQYTGSFRLIGIPGGFIELPGRGGPVTRSAAARALKAFAAGRTNGEAQAAAMEAC
jgi:hypothetical protein